jgi:hypothetical protein
MPYKHNPSRRHKIEKAYYKVTNWPDYNEALRQRGDITIWFTEEALVAWHPAKTGARGRPQGYSDLLIEIALFIRQVFYLRATPDLVQIPSYDRRTPSSSCNELTPDVGDPSAVADLLT